jgi:Sec-independent protein translocase protein TatA
MNRFGATEIVVHQVVALLLFGPGRVVHIGKALADLTNRGADEKKPV